MRSSSLGVLLSAVLLVAGCSTAAVTPPVTAPAAKASADASSGADIRPDDAALPHTDAAGEAPEEVLEALVAARNASEWRAAYSLFATPEADFETASREWAAARESYADFTVHEVRVIDPQTAVVRVTYAATSTPPPGAEPHAVVVNDPGEWWAMHKVAGRWRVQWLPRQ